MFKFPIGQVFRNVQSIYVHLPAKEWPDCGLCNLTNCSWLPYKPCKQCTNGESFILELVKCPMQGHCKMLLAKYKDTYVSTYNCQEIREQMQKDISNHYIQPKKGGKRNVKI